MRKVLNRIGCVLFALVLMMTSFKMDTQAAGGLSISASSSSVESGGTFTVTVSAAGNYFVAGIGLNVSGGTVVSGLSASSLDKGESATAKIQLTGDTCVVSVSGTGANYDTEVEEAASASVSVKKKVVTSNNTTGNNTSNNTSNNTQNNSTKVEEKPEDTRSKDNNLASLTVSEGTLSPAFSSGTTEYKVSLPGTSQKITISAKANDAKATVSGTGEKTLQAGDNLFTIVCEAENGSQKKYVVNVYVDETPLVFATYNGEEIGVVRNQNDIGVPATFEATTVTLDGQEVQAYHSNQYNLTLIYMVNGAGEKNFYIYDETNGITSTFRPVSLLGRNVVLYDLTKEEQVRENMIFQEMTIDGVTLYGWVYENPEYENYAHIPVMNEFGEKIIYQYEKTENSLQLYKEYVEEKETAEEPEEKESAFSDFVKKYNNQLIVGGVLLALIILTVIIVVVAKKKGLHGTKKRRGRRKNKNADAFDDEIETYDLDDYDDEE